MTTVDVNGISLEVFRARPAIDASARLEPLPTIIGIHGLVLDDLSSYYFTMGAALREHADVVLYDLRGHGRSDFTRSGYSIRQHVEDLSALLEALDITGPVHLMGTSFGGAVAVRYALAHPRRVAGLALLEGHYPVDGWGEEMATTLDLVALRISPEEVMAELGVWSARKATRISNRADLLINSSTLRQDLAAEPAIDEATLRSITCPTLCCYGEESDLYRRGRALAEVLPDCRFVGFAGASHSLLTERPDDVRSTVLSWLARSSGGIDLRETISGRVLVP